MALKLALLATLIMLAAILLWFLLSFLFKPVGKFFYRIYKDAKVEITNENIENNED